MRISGKKRHYNRKVEQKHRYKTNQHIKAPEVRLIDETGAILGVMPTSEALRLTNEKGLDLVEVSPLAKPPVAKILDYSKLRYQEEKEKRQQKVKQKKVEVKGIRLSLRIGKHDTEVRLKQALKFLEEGNKVKVEMILRGRERGHIPLAKKNIREFVETLKESQEEVKLEQDISVQGGRLSALIS